MLTLRATLLPLLLPSFALAQGPQPVPARTDVPVRTVVLFSSGVGYFEHAGTVRGNGSTEIRFKTAQINDVLKSLVLQDQDGGRVTAITYPSQDPLSKTLRSFQVDITANPSLADLLNQIRGARVTVRLAVEQVHGTILGVEMRRRPVDKGEPIQAAALNVLTGATIRSIELHTVRSLSLDDPRLEDELSKALAALSQARDQDKKPVTIGFTGTGERRLRIGYVVESPVWKTSYRLLLDGASARLQGWAIVENQTESDWNAVSLSLASGRPISFTMDLYRPLYASRPNVAPELYAGLRPQLHEGGLSLDAMEVTKGEGASSYGRAAANGAFTIAPRTLSEVVVTAAPTASEKRSLGFSVASLADETPGFSMFSDSTVRAVAAAAKVGELFQYLVPNVTLARQKSAMLPIVADSVGIERVSIYNASVLAMNPLTGVRLTNSTGKHLLQGPVTVLDGNGYAGDARIDNVPPGQDRLLSYGVDLDMIVDNAKHTQTTSVLSARISKGVVIVQRKLVASQTYTAQNRGDQDRRLVIEHPYRQGWKLVDTQKPIGSTPTLDRFQVAVPARQTAAFTVKEEMVRRENAVISEVDLDLLVSYSRTGEIPQAVRDALAKAIALKQGMADAERQMAERTAKSAEITQEQNRMRENMKTVATNTDYYRRLLAKLNEQESAIERLQKERADLTARRDAQRKELEEYVAGLTIG